MPARLAIAGLAALALLAGCGAKSPQAAVCPIASLPVYDSRPEVAAECKPMYDLCAEWRASAINLCSE